MPMQFAIEELIPNYPETLPQHISRWNSKQIIHPVPRELAEGDERGVFQLLNNAGEPVTDWLKWKTYNDLISKPVKSRKPHKDITGEELAVGDFVATNFTESTGLLIGRVISFAEKKVRVLVLTYRMDAMFKNPESLIKIQPSILSE